MSVVQQHQALPPPVERPQLKFFRWFDDPSPSESNSASSQSDEEVASDYSECDGSEIDIAVVLNIDEELSEFQAEQQQSAKEDETSGLIPISKKIWKLSRTPNVRDNQKTRKTKKVKKTQKAAE